MCGFLTAWLTISRLLTSSMDVLSNRKTSLSLISTRKQFQRYCGPWQSTFFFRNIPWMDGAKLSCPAETASFSMYVWRRYYTVKKNLPWRYILGKKLHLEIFSWTNLSSSGRTPSLISESSYHSGRPRRSPGENSVSSRTSCGFPIIPTSHHQSENL